MTAALFALGWVLLAVVVGLLIAGGIALRDAGGPVRADPAPWPYTVLITLVLVLVLLP